MSWLPDDFLHPVRIPVPGTALHLRPVREADTALDYPAVMGSRERLREIFGPAWDWPKDTMTLEEDRLDLLRHEQEIAAHQSFNYALLDEQETAILGCVYIDPPERAGSDGEVSWWVVDDLVGGEAERALDVLVPQWIAADWPFRQPRYLGRDITWQDWLALPADVAHGPGQPERGHHAEPAQEDPRVPVPGADPGDRRFPVVPRRPRGHHHGEQEDRVDDEPVHLAGGECDERGPAGG